MNLTWKPELEKVSERFDAWWAGEAIDRPVLRVFTQPSREYQGPDKTHRTLRDRWLDAEYNVEHQVAKMSCFDWVADTLPVYMPNIGPELTATLLGAELQFSEETSWSLPTVTDVSDWRRLAFRKPDFTNRYWKTVEREAEYAMEINNGRYLVGIADLHGNYDILAALREPQALCVDLLDDPEGVDAAAYVASQTFVAAFNRLYRRQVAYRQSLCSTWVPFLHDGPAYVPSCDFWIMLSPDLAERFVLPRIIDEIKPLERSVFHLDGPGAFRHLDLLLGIDELDAVQVVQGAGGGPATDWLEIFRRVRAAGKAVQVFADTPADALAVLGELGPEGLWIQVGERFETSAEAEAFEKAIEEKSAAVAR